MSWSKPVSPRRGSGSRTEPVVITQRESYSEPGITGSQKIEQHRTSNSSRNGSFTSEVSSSSSANQPEISRRVYPSAEQLQAFPWPKFTVVHLVSLLNTVDNVASHYRAFKLADHLNDEDLRCYLEEQQCKEKAGLSEMTIMSRLKTRKYVPSVMSENPDTCSICMVDYREEDEIASLYYCSHEYHAHCIREWLLKTNLCPLCRALAIIPEEYPSWDVDVRLHQAYFVQLQYTT